MATQETSKRRFSRTAMRVFSPVHPNWYLNLRKNREVTIELRGERKRMRAEIQEGAAREPLRRLARDRYPMFIDCQATRQVPVIVLRPAAGVTGSDAPTM